MIKPYVLPDSRTIRPTGSVRGPHGNLIPIYCANCGSEWGMVLEHEQTFAFVLCQPCAEKFGHIAHFYQEPDAAFWDRIRDERATARIAHMSPGEFFRELDNPNSPLSKLAKEWQEQAHRIKKGS